MKKPVKSFFSRTYVILFALFVLGFTIYIIYRASINNHNIFSLSFIFLLLGLIFESYLVLQNWKPVFWFLIGSYVFSLCAFLPGKHEYVYTFEDHFEALPYVFLCCYTFGFAVFKTKETTEPLTEGITLLLSLAIIYWVIDHGFWEIDNWFIRCLIIICLVLSAFSIISSLLHITLSKKMRLALSIWSSFVLLLFAIESIYRAYQNQGVQLTGNFYQEFFIGLQFFLLGVSAIYIAQNAMMLIEFMPGRKAFFNSVYFKELKELKNRHIQRYSDEQLSSKDSVITIIVVGTLYTINYKFNFLPRQTIIWVTIVLTPFVFRLFYLNRASEKLPTSAS